MNSWQCCRCLHHSAQVLKPRKTFNLPRRMADMYTACSIAIAFALLCACALVLDVPKRPFCPLLYRCPDCCSLHLGFTVNML